MRSVLSLVALAIFSHAANFSASAQDAAAERFKQRRNSAAAAANTADTASAAGSAASATAGDHAAKWYERRLSVARGGQNQVAGGGGTADANGVTPELRARMARDPRYRAAVIGYLQSMIMLQGEVMRAGEATSNAIRDRVQARERQIDRSRDASRDRARQDRIHADKVYERRRQRGGY